MAGTSHGIFVLEAAASGGADPAAGRRERQRALHACAGMTLRRWIRVAHLSWQPRNTIANTVMKTITETHMHTRVNIEKQVQAPAIELESP